VEVPGISYGCLNGTMKKIVGEGHMDMSTPTRTATTESIIPREPVVAEIVKVEDMEFPDFGLHKTGKEIDLLFSDHEEGGGQYGGTVTIVIGESGVGKSTLLLDALASIQDVNPDAKVLYVSSEMTKNDIGFYYKKTPAIGKVPTLLLMSHVKDGSIDQVMRDEFNKDYDIILLDSYQDVVVKLKEVKGWKSTFAESWLTNIMIDAAENNGAAIWAIQHMTKGGQYVGSTYLKHATTAMMELLFDDAGQRYVVFSKNRRGGSAVNKRMYFRLVEGEVVYDAGRFEETNELKELEDNEAIRQVDLSQKFNEIFIDGPSNSSDDDSVDIKLEITNNSDEEDEEFKNIMDLRNQ
jgi:predicted ATP-dependent serine protease